MVVYHTSNVVDPPTILFMGIDKYENEDLIKWGWPEDVWFHVDKLSSAHVYLRLRPGETIEDVPQALIDEACQLVKDNSISGRKLATVDVVYTLWSNLKKTADMEVGQIGYWKEKEVKTVKNVGKKPEVVKRLGKTREEKQVDLRAAREERDTKERNAIKEADKKRREEEKNLEKKRAQDAELRSYTSLMSSEKMKSNRDNNSGSDSDDFM